MLLVEPVHDKPARAQLGELLQRARAARGLSHRDVAQRVGVNAEDVRQMELGNLVPDGRMWARLKGSLYSIQRAAGVWRQALREQSTDVANEVRAADREDAVVRVAINIPDVTPEIDVLANPRAASSFGQALRICRVNGGLTTEDVAELVGVTSQAVSLWELDHRNPVRENYEVLLQVWPELADCVRPVMLDIPKPDGGAGRERVVMVSAGESSPTPPVTVPILTVIRDPAPITTTPISQAGVDYANALAEERAAFAEVQRLNAQAAAAVIAHQSAVARMCGLHDHLMKLATDPQKGIQ